MSDENLAEEIRVDVTHFVNTFCAFNKAFPDENQSIIDQIFRQIIDANKIDRLYVPGDRGQELIWVFEKQGVQVFKRVFHPGHAERPVGADFVLYKIAKETEFGLELGITAVQVKRNRGKKYFKFTARDLTQRNRLARLWGSAYYLMVDETKIPPLYCFIHADELEEIIERIGKKPPVIIPNNKIQTYCRNPDKFYGLFYSCKRGSRYAPNDYGVRIITYTRRSKRAIVELSTARKQHSSNQNESE